MKLSNSAPSGSKPWLGFVMLLLSVGTGGAGVYFARQYIDGQVAQKTAQHSVAETMMDVVVAARNMMRGETVYDTDLLVRSMPAQYVDSNTVGVDTYELAVGQRMDFDIDEGRPLLWAHLAGGVTPTFSGKVEKGFRAMTVRVDDINSISGFLQPGDRVDLFMGYGSDETQRILPLMDNLHVIATGVQTEADKLSDGLPRSFSTITVHVTPAEAQKLMLAQQVAKVTAILRHPEDNAELSNLPLSVTQLIKAGEPLSSIKPAKRKKRKAALPGIQYIIGGR